MQVGAAIFNILSTALVNIPVSTDISDTLTTYPQVIFKLSDADNFQSYSAPTSLMKTKVIIYIMSLSDVSLDTITTTIFKTLVFQPTAVVAGVPIQSIFYVDSTDSVEKKPDNQQQSLFIREMNFDCFFNIS